MNYTEAKKLQTDRYKTTYTWRISDPDCFEFEYCDFCNIETPLSDFSNDRDKKHLCEMCANTRDSEDQRIVNGAANRILIALGVFDDVEVVEMIE